MGRKPSALRLPWGPTESLGCGWTYADGGEVSSASYPRREMVEDARGISIEFSGADGLVDLLLRVDRCGEAAFDVRLAAETQVALARPVRYLHVVEIDLSDWLAPRNALWVFRHGTTSPGDPDICVPIAPGAVEGLAQQWRFLRMDGANDIYWGESAVLLRNLETGRGALFGFVTLDRQASRVELRADGDRLVVRAACDLWNFAGAERQEAQSETLRIEAGNDDGTLLDNWVAAVVDQAAAKPRTGCRVPVGWSDWQYYRREITQEDVLENVNVLESEKYPIEYVLVDDGFQARMSDWLEPNERFPLGMAEMARRIRQAGFKPGVWLAPFTAVDGSRLAEDHSDWLLAGAGGRPNWHESHMGKVCAIDYTAPGALEWLDTLIRTFVQDYGFRWIKLDGPILRYYEGGSFKTAGVTQVEVVRSALKVIRRAAGDAVVEGEGYYGPSIGLVDVQRVTQDIQTEWSRLTLCAQSNCLSGHFHRRLWINNPDAFIIRDKATPHYEPETPLSLNELQLEITALALSGGVVMLTDRMATLAAERKPLVAAFVPRYEKAARPVRLFEGAPCPSVFRLEVSRPFGSWEILAAYNWGDAPRDVEVPLGPGKRHLFDFWRREYLGVATGAVALDVAPHGVRLVSSRAVTGAPVEIVGTGVHVTQGGVEIDGLEAAADGRAIEFDLSMPMCCRADVYVLADGRLVSHNGEAVVSHLSEGLYRVSSMGAGARHIALQVL